MEKKEVKDKRTWKCEKEAGYESLALHIVKLAIQDYNQARRKKDYFETMALLRFFRSEWCQLLCNIDGEVLIDAAEKIHEEVKNGRRRNANLGKE